VTIVFQGVSLLSVLILGTQFYLFIYFGRRAAVGIGGKTEKGRVGRERTWPVPFSVFLRRLNADLATCSLSSQQGHNVFLFTSPLISELNRKSLSKPNLFLLFPSQLLGLFQGLFVSIKESQRDLIHFGRICGHISSESSSVLVGFVEGFMVEFGSQLSQFFQHDIRHLRCPVLSSKLTHIR